MLDQELCSHIQALQGFQRTTPLEANDSDPSFAARYEVTVRRIVQAVDNWLLRTAGAVDSNENYRPTVGMQLAYWVVGCKRGDTTASAKLAAVEEAYDLNFVDGILPELERPHHYGRLVPGPNPQHAINDGAEQAQQVFGRLVNQYPDCSPDDLLLYADGYDRLDHDDTRLIFILLSRTSFYYLSMQFRAAVVRQMLRKWLMLNDEGFDRLVRRAQNATGQLPHVPGVVSAGGPPDNPAYAPATCRDILGFVLTEAIDDDFYRQYFAIDHDRPQDHAGGVAVGLSPNGLRFLDVVRTRLAPTERCDELGEPSIGADFGTSYGICSESGAPVQYAPGADVARNASNTVRPAPGYPFDAIIVPSWTATQAPRPLDRIGAFDDSPICAGRCDEAKDALDAGLAPIIIVSGGAIYPQGTRVFDADLMVNYLRDVHHVQSDKILSDRRARHSTTNLRNVGRIMLRRGLRGPALIVTYGPELEGMRSQAYYYGAPEQAHFHSRCRDELGYLPDSEADGKEMMALDAWLRDRDEAYREARWPMIPAVPALDDADAVAFRAQWPRFVAFRSMMTRFLQTRRYPKHYIVFTPTADVRRWSIRDPLDP
jgi:hypothetical protein